MENASRALIMAGGILIALMIVGALMLMFNNLSSYQRQNDMTKEQAQVVDFNNQYISYDRDDLTLMELKTLYNKIESYNIKMKDEGTEEKQIKSNIETIYPNIRQDFSKIDEEDKIKRVFACTEIKYDSNGKINYMEFKKVG